jgi:predicted acetyltransferase
VDIDIRPIGPDRFDELVAVLVASFGEQLDRDHIEVDRPIFDASRSVAAFDGDRIIGGASIYPFELTVPGGVLPAAGVTSVGVLPTHRRRGVNTALMRSQMDALHEGGEPVAYLWASEGAIYQRFGYGAGTLSATFAIDRQHTAFRHQVEPRGSVRLLERDEALKTFPSVYERLRLVRPGMVSQDEAWWNHTFVDMEADVRRGTGPLFYATFESGADVDGYVAYRIGEKWSEAGPDSTLSVEHLLATTDDAYAALWRYCFDVDLVRHVKGWKRPVDEPLLHMLAEPRGLRFQLRDGAWLRVIEVAPALEARRYGTKGRLVLGLRDGFCPWNEGRWELEGSPQGASCRRTDAEPDLELDASDLAATYLGAVSFHALARAGRVTERTDGALRRADAMFATEVAPWCPHVF